MMGAEDRYRPNPEYFMRQKNITCHMRAILFDWMMEVCMEFQMKRETLYLAINFVDRYLSLQENLEADKLQLLGVTTLYVASKLEEIIPPKLCDFIQSTDNSSTSSQINELETDLLFRFHWRINPPLVIHYSNLYMSQWDAFIEGVS